MKNTIFITLLFMNFALFGQEQNPIPDSLKGKSYEELRKGFKNNMQNNKEVAEVYARANLWQGKQKKDLHQIVSGYRMYSIIYDEKLEIAYLDSIISVTKEHISKDYPAFAYLLKGVNYQTKDRDYEKAMKNYEEAMKYCEKSGNKQLLYKVKYNIGLLRIKIGQTKESLQIFKENYLFAINNNFAETNNYDYLASLFALADSFERNNKLDSATIYNKLGYIEAKKSNSWMLHYFVLNEAANHCHKKNYIIAIDSIRTTLSFFKNTKDFSNAGIAYFYLGKSYYKINKKVLGVKYLEKMDSIIQQYLYLMPEEREGYEILIEHYKTTKDITKQLYYVEKLVKVDSILHYNFVNISQEIRKRVDTPILLSAKQKIIQSLKNKTILLNKRIYLLGLFVGITLLIIGIYYHKQSLLKKQFKLLLENVSKSKSKKKSHAKTIDNIPKERVSEIITALTSFENKLVFLQNNINLVETAKILKTNTNYLSKVINHYKNKNFTNYLNELRINHAVQTLKKDKKLQNYTIEALAKEFGYNNAESFSKAFVKETGIYPSYFIKNIKKTSAPIT